MFLDDIRKNNLDNFKANERPINPSHLFKDISYEGNLFAPDVFHDLNQGVISIIVNALLKKCSKQQRIQIENICKENFKSYFKNGLVSGIEKACISGTGIQKYDFFIIFSIICNYISKTSNLWKLYLQLRFIINTCLSDYIMRIDLDEFEYECNKFTRWFSQLFKNQNTPFKVHHIDHYSDAIKNFGPLYLLSTLRYAFYF